jgi:hypothetical protein
VFESEADMNLPKAEPSEAVMLVEYASAQECYLHYDAFRWQSGTFLIAGVFVFWGLIASADKEFLTPTALGVASALVAVLMSLWVLYAHHYRQICLCKLHRIWELERLLGICQHQRLKEHYYLIYGPKGHNLDYCVYVTTSFGGIFISLLRIEFDYRLLITIPVILFTFFMVFRNEKRFQENMDKLNSVK